MQNEGPRKNGGAARPFLAPDRADAMTNFEERVLADLAELKAQVRALTGNGQPGRVRTIEDRLDRHEAVLNRARGLIIVLVPVLTVMHLVLHFALKH